MALEIHLQRITTNRLNLEGTRKRLKRLASSLGNECRLSRLEGPKQLGSEWQYAVRLRLPDEELFDQEATEAIAAIGWEVVDKLEIQERHEVSLFSVPELSHEVYEKYFADIYERDAHIRTIHSAVATSVATRGEVLSHVLLYGLPGACKTKLCEAFKSWFEDEQGGHGPERVAFVDGTTMTKAGLENWLLELADRNALPTMLVVDELEKQPMDNLLCLNNVMGSGMLCKLNAVRGHLRYPVKFVVVGIANDKDAVKNFRSGALWSRFSHRLRCVRPSEELCLRILEQIVDKIPNGTKDWAVEAMRFGWGELGQRDIRELKGHLAGGDRLLSGEWQDDQRAILYAADQEETALRVREA